MATLESFLNNRTAKESSKPMNFGIRGYLAPSALADRISDASANLSTLKQGILGGVGADSGAEGPEKPELEGEVYMLQSSNRGFEPGTLTLRRNSNTLVLRRLDSKATPRLMHTVACPAQNACARAHA